MSSIICYFSRPGNNYVNGEIQNLSIGNTEIAADFIRELTNADIFKIEPLVKYSDDYSKCTEEAQNDLKRDARPELVSYPENMEQYDTVYLAYPNYWGTMPMAVFTLLEKMDMTGKVIKPLCTHEGSGMGRSEADIKRLCPGATVEKGFAIHGAEVDKAKEAIRKWLREKENVKCKQ